MNSSSFSSSHKCDRCELLASMIRKQVGAFKTLVSLSPNLSWRILVNNIEGLVGKNEKEDVIGQMKALIDLTEDDNITTATKSLISTVDTTSTMDTSTSAMIPDIDMSPRKRKKKNKKGLKFSSNNNSLTPERLEEANQHIERKVNGTRPMFVCLLCNTELTTVQAARLHIMRVHYNCRFHCQFCAREFYDYTHKRDHIARAHGEHSRAAHDEVKENSNIRKTPTKIKIKKKKPKNEHPEQESKENFPKRLTRDWRSIKVRNAWKDFDLKAALQARVVLERIDDYDSQEETLLQNDSQNILDALPQGAPNTQNHQEDGQIVVKVDPFDMVDAELCPPPHQLDEDQNQLALYMPEGYKDYSQEFLQPSYPVPLFAITEPSMNFIPPTIPEPEVTEELTPVQNERTPTDVINGHIRKVQIQEGDQLVQRFECLMCGHHFKSKITASGHVRRTHYMERDKCSCGKDFYNSTLLRRHQLRCPNINNQSSHQQVQLI